MTRVRRNRSAEQSALNAAAERLLAGTPLRTTSGRLTATELIAEAGLRRDIVYADHKALVEQFQANAKARSSTPEAMRDLAAANEKLQQRLTKTTEQLRQERLQTGLLRREVAELTIELHLAHEQLAAASSVTRLPSAQQRQSRNSPFGRVSSPDQSREQAET